MVVLWWSLSIDGWGRGLLINSAATDGLQSVTVNPHASMVGVPIKWPTVHVVFLLFRTPPCRLKLTVPSYVADTKSNHKTPHSNIGVPLIWN